MSDRQIRILDSATIDRIAAGEVIERPASVVKEIIENALDAGARQISVKIIDGGLASISIEDDGHGIPFLDLPLAFERHATSKIASAVDIVAVGTFGFRGEALASIASVSCCEMISRVAEEEVGGRIRIVGGETEIREPAPRNRGTSVTISDLFHNTPARRKYMGTPQAEKRAVTAVVTSIALAHPEVRWLLKADDSIVLDLRPVESLPQRCRDILGASVGEHLARFEGSKEGFSASGLASLPTWTRGNRTQQYVFVNRRPIRNQSISQAIAQAYRDVIPAGRHPVVVLFLEIPAGEVDVNVHPAKTEVRLLLERRIFSLVRNALRDSLNLEVATGLDSGTDIDRSTSPLRLEDIAAAQDEYLQRHFGSAGASAAPPTGGQTGLFPAAERHSSPAVPASVEDVTRPAPFWQLHRTYIVTQIRGALVLIDQHNSHERVLYDAAQKSLAAGEITIPTQQLLFPAHLELSPEQNQIFQEMRRRLDRLGFTIQPFGGSSILVQGIPTAVKNWAEGQMLLDMLDDLAAGAAARSEQSDDLLASFSCHGAIKAGDVLTMQEMQSLVDQLFATDLPLSCPHGRPTVIQFSIAELEKRFGRR